MVADVDGVDANNAALNMDRERGSVDNAALNIAEDIPVSPPPKRKPKEIVPIASGYETPLTEIP
jgi:hypothetical protein